MGGYESDAGSRRSGYESDAGRGRRGRRSRRDRSPGPPVTTRGFMDERIRDGGKLMQVWKRFHASC